jgi:hypothetical protein
VFGPPPLTGHNTHPVHANDGPDRVAALHFDAVDEGTQQGLDGLRFPLSDRLLKPCDGELEQRSGLRKRTPSPSDGCEPSGPSALIGHSPSENGTSSGSSAPTLSTTTG